MVVRAGTIVRGDMRSIPASVPFHMDWPGVEAAMMSAVASAATETMAATSRKDCDRDKKHC